MVLTEPGAFVRSSFPRPTVGERDALLEVELTSVCGGDVKLYKGDVDAAAYPLVPGHEVVGRVAAAGDRFDPAVQAGERVVVEPYVPCYNCRFCHEGAYPHCERGRCYGVTVSAETAPHLWGGYAEYMYLAPNSKLHRVPESVPAEAACLASVIGNGLNWIVVKGDVSPRDGVTVIGPGVQGLASVLVAALTGAEPIVLLGRPEDEDRLELGRRLGATRTVTLDPDDATEEGVSEATKDARDIVVVTAPSTHAIDLSIDVVAPLGTIVLPAVTGGEHTPLDTDELVYKEVDIRTGIGQPNLMKDAVAVLTEHPDAVAQMISHSYPLTEAERAIRQQVPTADCFDDTVIHAALYPSRMEPP